MNLSISQKIKYRVSIQIIGVGILLGIVYVMFSNGFEYFYPYVNGFLSGLFIGALISYLELWVFTRGIRKLRFITLLAIRLMIYLLFTTMILFNVVIFSRMIRLNSGYFEVLRSEDFQYYILEGNFGVAVTYAMVFAFAINFTRMLSRKMGQGVLISFITGTFYQPRTQERIVMFVGLNNSSHYSDKLKGLALFRFINEYFYDITEPIVQHEGIIYEYVEDVIVITWRPEKGLRNANCIRSYFEICRRLNESRQKYIRKYQEAPHPVASIHAGQVVRSEIGSIKTQITFSGDIMNATARLLATAIDTGNRLLITAEVLNHLDVPEDLIVESLGMTSLRGKNTQLSTFSINEKEKITV